MSITSASPHSSIQTSSSVHFQQLRIGYICAILIRNLSFKPTRDRVLQSLATTRPDQSVYDISTADDADLALRLGRRNSKGKAKAKFTRRRSASLNHHDRGRLERQKIARPSSMVSTGGLSDYDLGVGQSPKPILKRATGSKESRSTTISPSASIPFSLSDVDFSLLPRSDSYSSSRSSHTTMLPIGHRGRTQSATSISSLRSVRFDSRVDSVSPTWQSRATYEPSTLYSERSLSEIMQDRLLECYVQLLSPTCFSDDGPLEWIPFYSTNVSRPGLHHTWGAFGGSPITPETDFDFQTRLVQDGSEFGMAGSHVMNRVWARKSDAARQQNPAWTLVCEKPIDLRDLDMINTHIGDPQLNLPPNTLLIGLSPGVNSLSGRGRLLHAENHNDLNHGNHLDQSSSNNSKGMQEKEQDSTTGRTGKVLEQINYYLVPLDKHSNTIDTMMMRDQVETRFLSSPKQQNKSLQVDGYASDPAEAVIPSSRTGSLIGADQSTRRLDLFKEQNKLLELSLRETKMVPSYTLDQAKSILEKQTHLAQFQEDLDLARSQLGIVVSDPVGSIKLRLKLNQQKYHLQQLHHLRDCESQERDDSKQELQTRRTEVERRRKRLKEAEQMLKKGRTQSEALTASIKRLQERIEKMTLRIHARHASMLKALEVIFPIDLMDASSLLFSIAAIPLPNGVSSCSHAEIEAQDKKLKEMVKDRNQSVGEGELGAARSAIYHPLDDDTISSALGLVAQLVMLLSSYLGTSVHYPMATAGSRAVVQDGISIMNGPRAFPLYAKGMERYRYQYAAFLLNKNIEQLMNVHNVTVLDIRHTLPNLKNLIVTVSAAPPKSHLTRKSHIGKKEIALPTLSMSPMSPLEEKRGSAQLGLGFPANSSSSVMIEQDALLSKKHTSRPSPESLITTRVLGSTSSPTPSTGDGAIESITRALNFFGSKNRANNKQGTVS